MITDIAIAGYRSIREGVFPLSRLTIVTGANGTGKSSFYRSLRLLADVSFGQIIGALAKEGGLASTMWAGPERGTRNSKIHVDPTNSPVRRNSAALKLGFTTEDYGYAIDLGFPIKQDGSAFNLDPEIKAEALWAGEILSRRNMLISRAGRGLSVLRAGGKRETIAASVAPFDSIMQFATFHEDYAELLSLREKMREWRFYDNLRTDSGAPARQSQIGTRTPVLAADGRDLAAAIQTIVEIGDHESLAAIIGETFSDSRLEVMEQGGHFSLMIHQKGLLRPLGVSELSEGTLRFIMLAAALLTPRPPPLMVLNEPETGLNPTLMQPLCRLISEASRNCQIVIVSHQEELVAMLARSSGSSVLNLRKEKGETVFQDQQRRNWEWPTR